MDSRGSRFGGLWQVGNLCERNDDPPNNTSFGAGGLDPAFLESWRPGGLEAVCLAGWLLMWDGS